MLVRGGARLARGVLDAVVRPSRLVTVQSSTYSSSRIEAWAPVLRLSLLWLVNVALYAIPLTLSGIGFTSRAEAPPALVGVLGVVGDSEAVWQFLLGVVTNSAYLTVALLLVLVSFHGAVLVARHSRGLTQSFHTVVYTTSIYLAGVFTVVMYVATTPGLERSRELLIRLQSNFIVGTLDLLGSDLTVAQARPGPLVLDGLSQDGELVLAVLVVIVLYFVYSLYLGARINHRMSRRDSLVVLIAIGLAPVVYVAASVLVSTMTPLIGI